GVEATSQDGEEAQAALHDGSHGEVCAPRVVGIRGGGDRLIPPAGVSPTFWRLVIDEPLGGNVVVDVGTGAGRIALALAPLAGRVVGIDRDPDLIEEARRRAGAAGLPNVEFVVADADALDDFVHPGDGLEIHPALVVAHLFLSDPLMKAGA